MSNNNTQITHSRIAFNQGMALLHLANMYPTLEDVILELVQNALDTDVAASRIWIKVSYQDRQIQVSDNGKGIAVDKMNERLATVAQRERKGKGALGQFGIGMISAMGKCDRFIFISCPEPHKNLFHEWSFCKDLANQAGDLIIPSRPQPNLTLDASQKHKSVVEWRSRVSIQGFTDDAFVSKLNIDDLSAAICQRYRAVMLRNNVAISLVFVDEKGKKQERNSVTASKFIGRKLEPYHVQNPEAGEVQFNMYIAPKAGKGGRKGSVDMGKISNDFRFPFRFFATSAASLIQEAMDALNSGLFEGEILAQKVTMHPNRQAFQKDDAYIGLCIAIEEWYEVCGKQHLDRVREERQDERYQEAGLRALKTLEELILKNQEYSHLAQVISSFKYGSVGMHHADVQGKKALGQQPETTLSTHSAGIAHEPAGGKASPGQGQPLAHRAGHVPATVAGPKGRQRKIVRGHSTGLCFSYEGMDDSLDLWKLDLETGILHFNVRHQLWSACERKDALLIKLQEYVALNALTLQHMPEHARPLQRNVLDALMDPYVQLLVEGDKVRGVGAGRKKKSSS